MVKLFAFLTCALLMMPPALLAMAGWDFNAIDGSAVFKVHPVTYLAAFAAFLPLLLGNQAAWATVRTPRFAFYMVAALLLALWAIFITGGQSGGGEISAVLVSFGTAAFMPIVLSEFSVGEMRITRDALRLFVVVNSIVALGEYATGTLLLPVADDMVVAAGRSAALMGHPLSSAATTGFVLVYLLTATNNRSSIQVRLAEILLHVAALFTYGGRSTLVSVPLVVAFTALTARRRAGAARLSPTQRLGAIAVLVTGGILLTLPLDIVQNTLARFTEDAGSAETRFAAFEILKTLDLRSFLMGAPAGMREYMRVLYGTELAIEVSWISLIVTYGVVFTALISVGVIWMFFGTARKLDLSATAMTIFFFVAQSSSVGMAAKSLGVAQAFLIIVAFSQPLKASAGKRTQRPAALPASLRPLTG